MSIWRLLADTAERCPEHRAVRDAGTNLSYLEFRQAAERMAGSILQRVEPGDRVAILARNCWEYACAYFAAARAGVVLVPWNTRLTEREHTAILDDSNAALLLHDDAFAEAATALDVPRCALTDALAGSAPRTEPPAVAPDDTAHLYYTSGTTGTPKGVRLTHRNVVAHAEMTRAELDLGEADVWGHIAPMFHLADAWATFAITLVAGTHAFVGEFTAASTFDAIERDAITMTNLVPTMLQRMIANDSTADCSSLRTILSGGAPIAPETVRAIVDRFGCEYVQTYGMTETSPFLTMSLLDAELRSLPLSDQLRYRSKTGRAVRGIELRVVGNDGRDVPRDETTVGEIRVRGATVTPGYWNKPDETAAVFEDGGWLRTGDLAVIDDRGFVTIVDRAKDVILTGGETVYSTEVENRLFEHPDVVEAAVIGIPDPDWGERVVAAVVLRSATPEAELLAFCREGLAGFKRPKQIRRFDELPKTGSGKLDKRALRRAW
ncbi:MAG: AMP-binding protein [Planctomycetes bacterium]|nr:AMP-binding protein [Planctomycetota bacterium]